MSAEGGHLLEVGVGTGIVAVPDYQRVEHRSSASISPSRCCARRISASLDQKLDNVEMPCGDGRAAIWRCPDRSFDAVVAQYRHHRGAATLKATLDEFARVLKPGGEIILVNHIGAESGPRRLFERCFAPLARKLGWRPGISIGGGWPTGPSAMAASHSSSVGRCRRSGIFL